MKWVRAHALLATAKWFRPERRLAFGLLLFGVTIVAQALVGLRELPLLLRWYI